MTDYNHMDWILHNTKGHTPAGYHWCSPDESPLGLDIKWCVTDARHDADGTTQEIEANTTLVKFAPLLREEVMRLRERLIRAYDWVEKAVHSDDELMADYTEYVCGGKEE